MSQEPKGEIVPVGVKPIKMSMTPAELGKEVKILDEVFKSIMQKGTDYDTIPGTPKPTLLKPGAEILLRAFHLEPVTEILNRTVVDDPENPFFDFDIKVTLYWILEDGRKVRMGDGMGNANTRETRHAYRWMWSNELPTDFNKQNAVTRKVKGGYVQYRRNSSPDEIYTLKNTVLKMAEKRALVDAVLKVTGADRIFTQDVEDMELPPEEPTEEKTAEAESSKVTGKPVSIETPAPSPTGPPPPPPRVEEPKVMVRILKDIGVPILGADQKEYGPFKVEDIANLPKSNAVQLIQSGVAAEIVPLGTDRKVPKPEEKATGWMELKASDGKVYGSINKTGDGAEVIFTEPIDMENPQTKAMMENWLFNKVFAPMQAKAKEQNKEFNYSLKGGDGLTEPRTLKSIKITGQIDDKQVKDLASPCSWAAMRAAEKKTQPT